MSETKTHLNEAISIIDGFLKSSTGVYIDIARDFFDSIKIPKPDPSLCSVDSFIKAALNRDTLRIISIFNNSFDYQDNKPLFDNIKAWGEKIKKYHNNDSLPTYLTWDDISNSKLQNILVQYLIEEKHDRLFLLRLNQFWVQKETEFYYHINKSLLNAEYLFIENYSKTITDKLKRIEQEEGGGSSSLVNVKKPRFIRDFFILAPKIIDLCERIKNAIKEQNKRRIETEDLAEENALRITSNLNIDDVTDNSAKLLHFTQSVIEMTAIDHIYKASSKNIGKLLTLWERCKDVDGIIWEKKDESISFSTIVDMVKTKTASMLHKMVFDNGDEKSRKYLDIKNVDFFFENSTDIKEKVNNCKLKDGLNKTIKYKDESKDKTIDKDAFRSNNQKLSLDNNVCPDIVDYNTWVGRGQDHYIKMSPIIAVIEADNGDYKQVVNKIEEFYNDNKSNIECFSPFFFISSICFINKKLDILLDQKQKESTDINGLFNLLGNLLFHLRHYIHTYSNSMPSVFRPYFEHSFYQLENGNQQCFSIDEGKITQYDRNNYKDCFFFASYCCNATNYDRLHDFYEKYMLQYQSFSYKLSQAVLQNETNKIINTNTENINTSIKGAKGEFDKAIDEQKREIERTRHSSLQTLGLFSAFLAFVVSSIGTFRVATNITEYIIYSLTFTLSIALFAFLISDRNENSTQPNKNPAKEDTKPKENLEEDDIQKGGKQKNQVCGILANKKTIAFSVTALLLLLVSVFYYCSNRFKTKGTPETTNGVNISIDNSSTTSTIEATNESLSSVDEGNTITFPNTSQQQ